jgi:tagatose-1,6-bisphosphate aldolase non-catalytic subunit AgaZ/GatZ
VKDEKELNDTIENMLNNIEYWNNYYNDVNIQKAINENYETSKKYNNFEEWFYKEYKKEIEGLFNEIQDE